VTSETDAGVREIWLEVDGLRVRCLTAGAGGPPTLLLHGGGFDSADFSYGPIVGPLSRGRRVFAPDWPGYGGSDRPDLDYDLAYYVDFLECLMDTLRLTRAALIGLSMGGGAALGFALRFPDRVERLVLVDSYGLGREIPRGRLGYFLARTPLAADLIYALMRRSRRILRWGLLSVVHDRRVVTDGLIEQARGLLGEPGSGRAFRSFRHNEVLWDGLRTDFSDRLAAITAPTLIIHGAHDPAVPVAWARRAHKRLPNSELRVFDACGHWPPRERPEEFNRVVDDFLSRQALGRACQVHHE
jgi:pimeloyl-ACP methyl ester carboxylesterase